MNKYLPLVVVALCLEAGAARACVPGIEPVGVHVWSPGEPVSMCVLPDGSGQGFGRCYTFGGVEIVSSLRILIEDFDGPARFRDMQEVLVLGGPASLCDPALTGLVTDGEGWLTVTSPIRGGGHLAPGSGGHVELIMLPVCPNRSLSLDGIFFNSPDINGDLVVDLSDVPLFAHDFFGAYDYRSDFNWDDDVNLSDVVFMSQALGAVCRP